MDESRCRTPGPPTCNQAEAGFTLIELMVATFIIVIGILGTYTLFDGALRTTQINNARIGAVNLARQVTESARTIDYDADLRPDAGAIPGVAAALQTKPGLSGSGNPWNIVRRGLTYSVQVDVCTFDDPKDGLATAPVTPPDNSCTPAAAAVAGSPTESNPDDFRRVTVTLTWQRNGATKTLRQTALIANPSGGLGPRILTFNQPTNQFVAFPQIANGVTGPEIDLPLTTSDANNVHWTVDSVGTDGEAVVSGAGRTSWTIKWPIGNIVSGAYAAGAVVDGTYAVDAQPFNDRGIPGETRTAAVALNRIAPLAPAAAAGGRNERFSGGGGVVDLEWQRANAGERDILGYRVYRLSSSGSKILVCPSSGGPSAVQKAVFCTDRNPPGFNPLTYEIYAVDLVDLVDPASAQREGAKATVTVDAASAAPDAPTGLTVSIVNGKPQLSWSAPSAGAAVSFYRIYRQDSAGGSPGLDDRWDATSSSAVGYDDSGAGGTSHTYWVTAVGASYNESGFSNSFTTP